ncbi:ferredoxin [Nocardia brasiliensis]
MRVVVDFERCCGAGQCVVAAPEVFDQDDNGVVVLLTPEPPPQQHADVREAVKLCPAAAITVRKP